MPMYEYQCADCSHKFEVRQKFSDEPISTCPKCGGSKVEKLISGTTFSLKGGGWYSEGYCSSKSDGGGCKGCPKG